MSPAPTEPQEFRNDEKAWELECAHQLELRAQNLGHEFPQPEVLSVYLEGEYPETRICVRYVKRSSAEERTKCHKLWTALFVGPDVRPDGRETPDQVALIVHTDILDAAQ